MAERITGINRSTLWLAWKEVRAALRDATIRDVVDFIDYDIEPEVWINRLLRQVSSGAYEPRSPLRFPLSKSRNFKRVLTFPEIPDVVLLRAIADYIHNRARREQQPHVYYRRRCDEGCAGGRTAKDGSSGWRLPIHLPPQLPQLA